MKFNSSNSVDDDYFQSKDHYVVVNEESKTICLQEFLVRWGPGDDYRTLMDDEFSVTEFAGRKDLQDLVRTWFGETTLAAINDKIAEIS